MTNPILKSERLILRASCDEDIAVRHSLGRNADIDHMFGNDTNNALTISDIIHWFDTVVAIPHSWIIEYQGCYIGEVKLHTLDQKDQRARIAIGIMDFTKLGQGLGTEAIKLVLNYGFKILGLHRIDLRVLEYNARAIHPYEKLGFKIEGRERESAFVNGKRYDDLIMGLLAPEYLDKIAD